MPSLGCSRPQRGGKRRAPITTNRWTGWSWEGRGPLAASDVGWWDDQLLLPDGIGGEACSRRPRSSDDDDDGGLTDMLASPARRADKHKPLACSGRTTSIAAGRRLRQGGGSWLPCVPVADSADAIDVSSGADPPASPACEPPLPGTGLPRLADTVSQPEEWPPDAPASGTATDGAADSSCHIAPIAS
jgi:hypothetical protein